MKEDSTVTKKVERNDWEKTMPQSLEARLLVTEGKNKGSVYVVPMGATILGRTKGDIIFEDPKISRKHCLIEVLGSGVYYLKDLASSNGTFLNHSPVTVSKLEPGDLIRIGDTTLKFYISKSS